MKLYTDYCHITFTAENKKEEKLLKTLWDSLDEKDKNAECFGIKENSFSIMEKDKYKTLYITTYI